MDNKGESFESLVIIEVGYESIFTWLGNLETEPVLVEEELVLM